MKRRSGFNPKRQLVPPEAVPEAERAKLAMGAMYTGNPEHKRLPGDFGLTPPGSPRPGKTLCDEGGVTDKATAGQLLQSGIQKGMLSSQRRSGWPQNIWSVLAGVAFEAQLENESQGTYHGYPMPLDDDFRTTILREWAER